MASSIPATSAKVTFFDLSVTRRARLFPKAIAFPPPPCICRMKKIQTPIKSSIGSQETSRVIYQGESSTGFAEIRTPLSFSNVIAPASLGA